MRARTEFKTADLRCKELHIFGIDTASSKMFEFYSCNVRDTNKSSIDESKVHSLPFSFSVLPLHS